MPPCDCNRDGKVDDIERQHCIEAGYYDSDGDGNVTWEEVAQAQCMPCMDVLLDYTMDAQDIMCRQ
ncbi:MAG: hypothetical protein U9P10_13050 [Thermodesulfobacteriota bacterium]|nr:hypothetical protein [Thermodesulfobacteriota bacterium]